MQGVFYFICAISVNNLLLRKDLCHWSKGMQIRYNLSHLEQWCRDMRLQIIKILNLYTTIDESEECVPVSFICRIQAKLLERSEPQKQATLLMDTKFMFPVRFPFNPSKIKLEDIEVPEVLNLPMLKKVSTCESSVHQENRNVPYYKVYIDFLLEIWVLK
ncbi:unconventional myosin-Vb-like [Schistocerca americana]|uniref:unconventional myosin-Vb-like n=1 Tax=Schistocerca americana TaxID=7009 RepID=UPI001F4F6991|nr:unconventional myosin-Vb-like [Schistocerca americana]